MSKKSNPAAIGAFVIGAVILIVAAIVAFGSGRFFKQTQKYVLFFEGSVNGLAVGAPVAFRGVRIGSVTDIRVLFDGKDLSLKIPVFIEIDPSRIQEVNSDDAVKELGTRKLIDILLDHGLKAQLGMQSLVTGQLYVNLDFHPQKPARLVKRVSEYQELPTIPSPIEEISRTIETLPLDDLANKLLSAIEGIEKVVNSPELKTTMKSLEEAIIEAKNALKNIGRQVQPLSMNLEETLGDARKLLQNMNARVNTLMSGIERTVSDTRSTVKNIDKRIDPLVGTIQETFIATRAALKQVNATLEGIEGATGEGSVLHYQVTKTLQELSAAARSVRILTDYLERHPEALLRGKSK
ncbi:MlaD family protein [Desulfoferrobacter suflitae]|uniref:MlaD family protein n=1 Tax=Desulfoferrobacter suflitae TaxID=2865782 RepID=UPI002164E4EF|nr:MlaD family protein [Desulfoferrobacter suflitae]MCK8601417.1 MlaD family protein [Desulfoferrobacter suflitae]